MNNQIKEMANTIKNEIMINKTATIQLLVVNEESHLNTAQALSVTDLTLNENVIVLEDGIFSHTLGLNCEEIKHITEYCSNGPTMNGDQYEFKYSNGLTIAVMLCFNH